MSCNAFPRVFGLRSKLSPTEECCRTGSGRCLQAVGLERFALGAGLGVLVELDVDLGVELAFGQ